MLVIIEAAAVDIGIEHSRSKSQDKGESRYLDL